MKAPFFRLVLYFVVECLTYIISNRVIAAPLPSVEDFCGVIDSKHIDNRNYARSMTANLNAGEPRTVRMIHFLPNSGVSSGGVVQKMKMAIRETQSFYTAQMPHTIIVSNTGTHEKQAFQIETNRDDEPIVHTIRGEHPDNYYRDKHHSDIFDAVWNEIKQTFHIGANVYLVAISNGSSTIGDVKGVGGRAGKTGGMALVSADFTWDIVAHELGHAFGLQHNFHDSRYIMAYGGGQDRTLSDCNVRFLSKHPYFNDSISTKTGSLPIIELVSENTYRAGSESVSVQFAANDTDDRIHQMLLFAKTRKPHSASGHLELLSCNGRRSSSHITLEYDGKIPSAPNAKLSDSETHRIYVKAIDVDGDINEAAFTFREVSVSHITTIEQDENKIRSLSFSPNGRQLAAIGNNLHVWNNLQPWDLPALKLAYVTNDLSKYVLKFGQFR